VGANARRISPISWRLARSINCRTRAPIVSISSSFLMALAGRGGQADRGYLPHRACSPSPADAIPMPVKRLGSSTATCTSARKHIRGRVARYPQPAQDVALSNQYRVCSSVQPGTAKRSGAVTPRLGRTMTCWRVCKCSVDGLERCTVAASAEAHRMINRPKAKTERIAIAPIDLPPFCAGRTARLTRRKRSQQRTAGARGRAGTVSAGGSGAGREIARY
jgi:hypothetical protein